LSMGAGIALRLALAHPERVRGLVLAAFPAGRDAPGSFSSLANAFAESIEREGLERAGERFVWGPSSGLDPQAAAAVRRGFSAHAPQGWANALRGVMAVQPPVRELVPELGAITQPALVIVGDRDRMSLESSRALAAAIPQAHLVVVEGAGHVVNLANPLAFNAALESFLRSLD